MFHLFFFINTFRYNTLTKSNELLKKEKDNFRCFFEACQSQAL